MRQTSQILSEEEHLLSNILYSLGILCNYIIRFTANAWYAVLSGTIGGIIIGLVTEYYTGGAPVRKIAEQGQTGSATVITTGLSIGLQSVVVPSSYISCNYFLIELFCWIIWSWYRSCWYVSNCWNNNGN